MSSINLNEPFHRETCVSFFQDELLPEDFTPQEEEIDLLFNPQYIQQVTFLGDSRSLGIKVYQVTHASPHDPRVSLTRETFRLMKEYNDFHVLAFYTTPGSLNYRLSYVTIGITAEDKKVKYEYSNPRRYSYYLGPDAKVNTPARFLIKKGRIVDIDDLQERFSVEVVNKEFYRRIAALFTGLVGGKRKDGTKTSDYKAILKLPSTTDHQKMQEFAVRMIGRIVFCWFLKKKSAPDGDSLIPGNVLSLTAVKGNKNYYHTVLEKLFFQVLNTPIKDRGEEFKTGPFSRIPFLNGGLFEPHHDDFYESNELTGTSKYDNTLIVPDNWMEELFELLEEYNFTIDENTSMDVELSVDPEMLGRIFENLLAEINPETGETARKSTGSYYTPRPIVEYMVDESLKQYLLTKTGIKEEKLAELLLYSEEVEDLTEEEKGKILDALDEVKIIDPACGSGAFPMGILQKMVLILQKADPDSMNWLIKQLDRIPDTYVRNLVEVQLMKEDWNYIRKLGLIQNSIYGVDIQQIAVEISKLRVFLSLIVDSKIDDAEENRGIKPLPNLEFKFVCANTLIGLPKVTEKAGSMFEAHAEIKKLKSLRESYFSSFGSKKQQIEKQFREIQDKMFKHSLEMASMGEKTLSLIDWDPFSDKASDWFDPDWMFGIKEGFDIVIANPPYGAELSEDHKKYLKKQYIYLVERIRNSFLYFIGLAYDLTNNKSIFSFIIPNEFLFQIYMTKARRFFLKNAKFLYVFNLGEDVFDAIVPSCIISIKKEQIDEYLIPVADFRDIDLEKLEYRLREGKFEKFSNNTVLETVNSIFSFNLKKIKLSNRLQKKFQHFEEFCDLVSNGICTSCDEVYIVNKKYSEENELNEFEKSFVKPCIRGGQINRYFCPSDTGDRLLYITKDFESIKGEHIIKYLNEYHNLLVNKSVEKKKGNRPWHILFRGRDEKLFQIPKIMFRQTGDSIIACIDETVNYYAINSVNIAILKSVFIDRRNYLLGILNSKLTNFIYKEISQEGGRVLAEVKPQRIRSLPIAFPDIEKQKPLEKLVDLILAITKDACYIQDPQKQAKVKALEEEIDRMVYKLYELTPEEIAIVEGELKK
jgi:adenine-specific DNA-methyltransferase